MSKKDKSGRALREFGLLEEYYNIGCSPKTIARLTGLDVPRVKSILKVIEKKKAKQKELQSKEGMK